MKIKILLVFILLISNISFASEYGKLMINNVEIPYTTTETTTHTISTEKPIATFYINANGQRIAKREKYREGREETFYFHNDHLGSATVITDKDGKVVEEKKYSPFGIQLNGNSKIGYNSKELDKDTDLNYYGARYYGSEFGRFITADTVKGKLVDPQSLNIYVYTQNNPLKYIDPSGNQQIPSFPIFVGTFPTKEDSTAYRYYRDEKTKEGYRKAIPLEKPVELPFKTGGVINWDHIYPNQNCAGSCLRFILEYQKLFYKEDEIGIIPSEHGRRFEDYKNKYRNKKWGSFLEWVFSSLGTGNLLDIDISKRTTLRKINPDERLLPGDIIVSRLRSEWGLGHAIMIRAVEADSLLLMEASRPSTDMYIYKNKMSIYDEFIQDLREKDRFVRFEPDSIKFK